DAFREYFGHFPRSMANHYNEEAIYWGSARVGGWRRLVYNLTTRWTNEGRFFGDVPGHRAFWGDVCQQRIQYCRNFAFRISTRELNPEFRRLMERIAKKPGWFVPVSTLLDFLKIRNGAAVLNARSRRSLETRWLWEKLFRGTS
ncbi:MAG: hypothetical protein ACJ74Y_05060, partial [Bryobacteraceae bacterium]